MRIFNKKNTSNPKLFPKRHLTLLSTKIWYHINTILIAFMFALGVREFAFTGYNIPTGSMMPTLMVGDYIWVNKMAYGLNLPISNAKLLTFAMPKRGEIVVFHYPHYETPGLFTEFLDLISLGFFGLSNTMENPKNFIKRIIAVPGDTLEIKKQNIFISGEKLAMFKKTSKTQINNNPNDKYKDGKYEIQDEIIDNKPHLIQWNLNHPNFMDIPILHVPKKNDHFKLQLLPKTKHNPKSMLKLFFNNKLIHFMPVAKFFPLFALDMPLFLQEGIQLESNLFLEEQSSKFYPYQFYNEFLLSKDSGKEMNPNHIQNELVKTKQFEYTFKKNYYFVMGDNRSNSADSRHWGFVAEELIVGTPMFLYWPLHRFGSVS